MPLIGWIVLFCLLGGVLYLASSLLMVVNLVMTARQGAPATASVQVPARRPAGDGESFDGPGRTHGQDGAVVKDHLLTIGHQCERQNQRFRVCPFLLPRLRVDCHDLHWLAVAAPPRRLAFTVGLRT